MAWTTPRDWTALELVTAAYMDQISDNLNELWKGTTAGDTDYYSSSTAKTRLAIGSAYQFYMVNSGATAPSWSGLHFATVYKSSTQSYTTGSTADITFNAEVADAQGWHDNSSNSNRITVGANGTYVPFVSIYWNKDSGGTGAFHLTCKVQLNAADTANRATVYESIDAVTKTFTFGGVPVVATAAQYFTVSFSQDSGGSGNIIGSASNGERYTTFTLLRIA